MNERVSEYAKICTINWIKSVVIGLNFCPFAAKAVSRKTIKYTVVASAGNNFLDNVFRTELDLLDQNDNIETTLIIFENDFKDFQEYLDLVELAEDFIESQGYEGIYQVASFHPLYRFEGSSDEDPENYTNRSPFPMLHLLREDSISYALDNFKNPEIIPERNMEFARKKGLDAMKKALKSCL